MQREAEMVLYEQKYNNEREIWEELSYWLQNPIAEKEQVLRDKEIEDYHKSIM